MLRQRQCSSLHTSTSYLLHVPASHTKRPYSFRSQPHTPYRLSVRGAASTELVDRPIETKKSGRVILESEDELKSTSTHRAIVWGAHGLLAALAASGLSSLSSTEEALATAGAVVAAYLLADLGTGIYHWSVDNYGSGETPFVGDQIAAFQGHHQRPWTITEREFCNNVHKVFKPALPFASFCLLLTPFTSSPFETGMALFIWLVCMSQQFHAWSHMKASELHPAVLALQNAGLLISRKAHGAHHKAPFEGNYCIVSGIWNDFLDDNGSDDAFFRRLERFVHAQTGVEPRCWNEPNYEWVDSYYADGTNAQ